MKRFFILISIALIPISLVSQQQPEIAIPEEIREFILAHPQEKFAYVDPATAQALIEIAAVMNHDEMSLELTEVVRTLQEDNLVIEYDSVCAAVAQVREFIANMAENVQAIVEQLAQYEQSLISEDAVFRIDADDETATKSKNVFCNLYVTHFLKVTGSALICGPLTVNNTFRAQERTPGRTALVVFGNADFKNDVLIEGDLIVEGTTTINDLIANEITTHDLNLIPSSTPAANSNGQVFTSNGTAPATNNGHLYYRLPDAQGGGLIDIVAGAGGGTVMSLSSGNGIVLTPDPITVTGTIATNATSANTPNTIVSRNGSGNFAAGNITVNDSLIYSSTGTLTTKVPAVVNPYTITWPSAVATTNGQGLTSTTAGVLSWSDVILNGGNSFGANISIGTNDAFSTSLRTSGTDRLTIASDGATTIGQNITTQAITIGNTSQTGTITLGNSTSGQTVAIASGTGANTVTIANNQTGGSVAVGTAMTTGTITIGGTSQTGAITLGQSTATNTINIGTGSGATTVNMATGTGGDTVHIADGAGANTVTLGSTNTTSTTTIQAGSGKINLSAAITTIVGGNFNIPTTSSSSVGVITQNNTRLLHTFGGVTNLFVGNSAGNFTLTGTSNTGIGNNTLNDLTSGSGNIAVGTDALTATTSGNQNVGIGGSALFANTTGSQNIAIGGSALLNNLTGQQNVAIGAQSLQVNTASENTAVGFQSLVNNTGTRNIGIGYQAGLSQTTGSNCIYLANSGVAAESGIIRVGTAGTQTKCFIAGIRGVTTDIADAGPVLIDSAGQLGTASSSIRYKENIQDMSDISDKVMQLKPVTFNYISDKSKFRQPGLIAEQADEIFGHDFVIYNEEGQPETVRYQLLPIYILKAWQEDHKRVLEQQATIDSLQKRLDDLYKRLGIEA